MKKAFGIIDILIALCIIGVAFALMNGKNPIVQEHERLDVQRKQINETVDQVQKLKEESVRANEEILNSLDE